jgi:6-phosphogluconate dehydrogenase
MGENLALNVERNGFPIAVYNRTASVTEKFIQTRAQGKNVQPAYSLEEFVRSLERPRKIMIMVKAGAPVDAVINQLRPLLDPDDMIIDGGNSLYTDTERRVQDLESTGLRFMGMGVSGGEEGALNGPSLMPGGTEAGYKEIEPIVTKIAAQVDDGPCVTYIGPGGSGHYVKMVHNGIEYGDMQLICEAYALLKGVAGLSNAELYDVFATWNKGELDSYLIEITRDIFSAKDEESGKDLVDVILDRAGAKGTGKWMSQLALDLGVPSTLVTEAVYARCLSALKEARVRASKVLAGPRPRYHGDKAKFIEQVRQALYASKICSYAQGYAQLQAAAKEHDWPLNFGSIALLWRGGCIIRAVFLERIRDAFEADPNTENLLLAPYFREALAKSQDAWREVIGIAAASGVPIPAFMTALAYYDGYRSERLPANLLQAQRDYFGAHTYERTDKPGSFHTEWLEKIRR